MLQLDNQISMAYMEKPLMAAASLVSQQLGHFPLRDDLWPL